jgi:hypothetical protein
MNYSLSLKPTVLFAACALLALAARAQVPSGFDRPLTLQPADPTGQESGASGDDQKAKAAEMAKTLANPIGALISVPLQNNFDFGAGPNGEGFQYKLNLQPIVPITLNEDWLLISRTILPIVYQENVVGTSSQAGLSDTLQSFFLSPVKPTGGGWIWGAGPALLFPTATDDLLGSEKWGAGPTAVVLKQQGSWTYGALANHIWSFAGENGRTDVSATYLQPFVSFVTKQATTFTLNTESTYDWEAEQWVAPMNLMVQQLVRIGKQPVALTVGGRYYADKPNDGPNWGLRFAVICLFPK